MKIQLLLIFSIIVTLPSNGQTRKVDHAGVYKSNVNTFDRHSIMTLDTNHKFTYEYSQIGCKGEVKGKWEIVDKKIQFENDSIFLNDPKIPYPNLGLSPWVIWGMGIKPEKTIDSGCMEEHSMHLKEGFVLMEDYNISLVRLIATPERYHGKKIQIVGYLNLEFEGDAIYLHKEDYEHSLNKNSFSVSFSNKLDRQNINYHNKSYVLIEGTFRMDRRGHMGLKGGEIYDITRIIKWGK
ncbi:hypothetical protein EGI22_11205 [Lacihabitans sp. LS3-19]|uniref:hypothetical protein n=1 Tax=Lacihabitans sp. LS3-19 TaxID=2487335 RepID=UPI0020CD8F84|nr:hypothetical protein [Lacihabitans sp. LS3-19]MCP9768481.1 hypothetical protein [Lacihabitans sp. LS3-19]